MDLSSIGYTVDLHWFQFNRFTFHDNLTRSIFYEPVMQACPSHDLRSFVQTLVTSSRSISLWTINYSLQCELIHSFLSGFCPLSHFENNNSIKRTYTCPPSLLIGYCLFSLCEKKKIPTKHVASLDYVKIEIDYSSIADDGTMEKI